MRGAKMNRDRSQNGGRSQGGGAERHGHLRPEAVIAIDPGRDKCGIAVARSDGTVIAKAIVPRQEAVDRVMELARMHEVGVVVLGDRTGSRAIARELEEAAESAVGVPLRLVFVDEHESSMEGRRRYLEDHPLRGLGRLVPVSLRTPGEPFDDYVAVVLAERFFHSVEK